MDTDKIAKFIKEQRTLAGLTQKQLAEKLGCTDKAVSRWETGRGMPDISFLMPLSEALGVSVGELVSGERYERPAVEVIESENEPFVHEEQLNKIIKKNDEAIVSVMTEGEKQKKKQSRASLLTLAVCCFQVFVFFGLPRVMPEMSSPINLMIIITAVNSVLVGVFGNNSKWLYPLFIFLILFFVNAVNLNPEGWVVTYIGALFAAASLGIILVCEGIKLVNRKLHRH